MRCPRLALLTVVLFAFVANLPAASQIQAFKSAPARPATAAGQQAAQASAAPQTAEHDTAEARTEHALSEAKANHGALYAFLREMPKGGDLHNHMSGSIYAEELMRIAAESNMCVDRQTLAIVALAPCKDGQAEMKQAYAEPELYARTIDAWSMRNSVPGENGHDRFFATFSRFSPVADRNLPQLTAIVSQQAADGGVQYLELMTSPDHGHASALGKRLGWDSNFSAMRQKLFENGMEDLVTESRKQLDEIDAGRNAIQHCGTVQAQGGCQVHVRYIYTVLRALRPEQVFAQMLIGFELASRDPRMVSLNLVQPEDWYVPMHDFRLHMQMISYLRNLYPTVHLTLHAGELRPGLVPPDGVRNHIRESIEFGHAERIGHGVDVMYEDNPHELLAMMARRNVLVEICLSSNDVILGVAGKKHPLQMYLKAGVPVALATDDEGVSRSEITKEFEKAVLEQGVDYATLKRMVRNSIEHSFLPGASLWSDTRKFGTVRECSGEKLGSAASPACNKFLNSSEKAREQWRLEHRLAEFESKF